MRLPTRKAELSKRLKISDEPVYMTLEGKQRLERTIKKLEAELPQAIEDVRRTGEFGDFSENEEYKEAKYRMRSTRNRITRLKEKLKLVVVIEKEDIDQVQLGSTVVLESIDGEKTFELVGPQETDPARGRISHKSPIGIKLMGKAVHDEVNIATPSGDVVYTLVEVK